VGVNVGITDKKWGSNAAYGPLTRKSGGQLPPGPRCYAAPGIYSLSSIIINIGLVKSTTSSAKHHNT